MDATRQSKTPTFKQGKDSEINWESFNGGFNSLYKPTELRPNELAQADNLMLIGKGTPTGRWGSALYNLAGTGHVRLLDAFYNTQDSKNDLLAVTDMGYLVKKSGASYSIITGASFASGYNYQSTQLGGYTYIANNPGPFLRYDGSSLIPYQGLSSPTNVSVAKLSGASGYSSYSWVVTAVSTVGETLSSTAKTLSNLPLSMASAYVRLTWDAVSSGPSVLSGYNIYRGQQGDETLLASLGRTETTYVDQGDPNSEVVQPQVDTTEGPVGKYIMKMGDRIVMAGFPDEPSLIKVSARYPYQDNFTALYGGGDTPVAPDDGDDITGIGLQHLQTATPFIIVYKKHATYVVSLGSVSVGNYSLLDLQVHPLTYTAGASSGDTVIPVENDFFAFGKKGLYSTGQEPQFLNQIRTNEISARIRPYVQGLTDGELSEATAGYIDYKYLLSFASRKETMIYDYQRACFMGPWKTPFGITKWFKYYDTDGAEKWLAGADNGNVYEFAGSYTSDNGTTIAKTLRTSKNSFGLFEQMKMLKMIYLLFRNCRGITSVNILAEGRDGNTTVTKSFNITSQLGSGGWGGDLWGDAEWGDTDATVTLTGEELARYSLIFKQFRVIQVEVVSTEPNSNFEFLAFKATAVPLGGQSMSSKLKV
jgi:hypothetical protein